MYSATELDAVEQFIFHNANIVPYNPDGKYVPKGFSWSENNQHLESMDEVRSYNTDGWDMAIVLETANCVLVDIDNLLPMTIQNMKAHGVGVRPYRKMKKKEWKELDETKRVGMLTSIDNKAQNALPSGKVMFSGSRRGIHYYYRVLDTEGVCEGHTNIEIFGNRRLGFVTQWDELADYWDTEPIEVKQVLKFWKPEQKALSDLEQLKPDKADFQAPVSFKTDANGVRRLDYEAFINASAYAAVSDANACWMWLTKAYQLNDPIGVQEGIAYFSGLLPDRKINKQHEGARNFAAKHPDTTTPRYASISNRKPLVN